jgi:hypothetical protein
VALSKTLEQLRTSLKRKAGVNSTGTSVDLTPDVLDEIINDAIYEGHDVITGKWLDYFTVGAPIPIVAGTGVYAVPSLFYKLRLLEHAADQQPLKPVALEERRRFYGQTGTPCRYLPMNRQIHVFPTPSVAETLTLWYVPIKPELVSASDTLVVDVPIELKYIMAIAWRDVLDRQNLDPSPAIAKMQAYEAKLRTAADGLDAHEPFYLNPNGPNEDDIFEEVPR